MEITVFLVCLTYYHGSFAKQRLWSVLSACVTSAPRTAPGQSPQLSQHLMGQWRNSHDHLFRVCVENIENEQRVF